MTSEIWRVTAYSNTNPTPSEYSGPDETGMYKLFDHHFSTRDKAMTFCEVGEKTMGINYGLTWHLRRIPIDTPWAQEDMDELAAELTQKD